MIAGEFSQMVETPLELAKYDNAYVAPVVQFKPIDLDRGYGWFDSGAYDHNSQVIPLADHKFAVMRHEPASLDKSALDLAVEKGRYLYLGLLDNVHFGHFISDGMARLWAASLPGAPDRLIYSHLRPHAGAGKFMQDVLKGLLGDRELIPVQDTRRFERLWVPQAARFPGGFVRGTPETRQFFAQAVDRIIDAADGPSYDKVYVSRTGLNLKHPTAALFLETLIEENLRQEGYFILHPQELPFDQQLLIYRNAKQLVFAEGSALHVYPLAGTLEQNCFAITRSRIRFHQFDDQIASFGLSPLQRSPHPSQQFIHLGNRGPSTAYLGAIDLAAVKESLVQSGFITGVNWRFPCPSEIEAELERLSMYYKIDAGFLRSTQHSDN